MAGPSTKTLPKLHRALPPDGAKPVARLEGLHVTVNTLPANAVDTQGRVIFDTSSADSFFYGPALYDPARKTVTRVPVRFGGSIWSPLWIGKGRVAALGARFARSMWRYHPVK